MTSKWSGERIDEHERILGATAVGAGRGVAPALKYGDPHFLFVKHLLCTLSLYFYATLLKSYFS